MDDIKTIPIISIKLINKVSWILRSQRLLFCISSAYCTLCIQVYSIHSASTWYESTIYILYISNTQKCPVFQSPRTPLYSLLYLHWRCLPYSMYSRTMMTFTEHSTVSATCVSRVSPESREHLQHVVSSRRRRNEHTVCQKEKLQLIIQLESKHEDE